MKKISISKNEENQRLDKFLKKYFKNASFGFLYKMLRKKNITLNDKKADGGERLAEGDTISVYFSEETFAKMKGNLMPEGGGTFDFASAILYENEDTLAINKPAGILSQSNAKDDNSVNAALVQYGREAGFVTEESLHRFCPSAMNRLDRNTSGILLCAKTYAGARYLDDAIKGDAMRKIYHCICFGRCEEAAVWEDFLKKDTSINKVDISDVGGDGFVPIKTGVTPLAYNASLDFSLLEVELFTGKSHQIRAHLAYKGYPIVGDPKYGDKERNARFFAEYSKQQKTQHARHQFRPRQLLHAAKVYLPEIGWIEVQDPIEFLRIFPKNQ